MKARWREQVIFARSTVALRAIMFVLKVDNQVKSGRAYRNMIIWRLEERTFNDPAV